MSKQIIHFAHANGFPAKTYNKLFSYLESDFEIGYIERHAHNPKFPVTDGWERLRDELRDEIEKRYAQRIIGIGHSLGGILHFLVAVEKPELYEAIILLDAPIISRLSSGGVRILKTLDLLDRFSPSQITRFRRNLWQSKDEVFEHFRQKEKFAAFDEAVLRDYAEYGTVETQRGYELFFKPSIEAKIYRTLPHNLPKFRRKLKVPVAYIGGNDSQEARLARLSFMRKHFPFEFYFLDGSHLFPLEKPQKTAEMIRTVFRHLSQ
ncbi:MAG: alpha/beta hydrolase [Acidobacteria bacterium]|nr:alpha/beta hydrolase [Acidobacteriota bacterium]